MKKKYIVVKETPELKKGAIIIEKCDSGSQGFECRDKKYLKFSKEVLFVYYARGTIMKQPDWFQEIVSIEVPKGKLAQAKKLLKSKKIIK